MAGCHANNRYNRRRAYIHKPSGILACVALDACRTGRLRPAARAPYAMELATHGSFVFFRAPCGNTRNAAGVISRSCRNVFVKWQRS